MEKNKMTEWRDVKLSDLISIKHGYAFKGEFFSEEETSYILVTPGNFNIGGGFKSDKFKWYNGEIPIDYILKKDDLIVTMTDLSKNGDTLGYSALVPELNGKMLLHNQRIGLVEIKSQKIDKLFLYWLMRTSVYQKSIVNTASGSTVKHTSPDRICQFSFSRPPLDIQRKIAGILGALDDKIEVLREQNKTLEQMAQAVFQSWFVDFDIVRAKAAGLPAADICKKYHITPDIYDLFPSTFSADNLPQGWTIGKIKNLCFDIQSGGTPQRNIKEYWCPPTIPWLSSGEVNFPIIIHTKEKISEEGLRNSSAKIWKKYTTVVAMYGATAGETTLLGIDVSANQACCALIPYKYTIYYVYLLAKANKNIYALAANGAAQQNLNKTKVSELEVIIPDAIILTCFQNLISSFFEKIIENSKQIRTLEQTRDTLLPQLISGNIEV